MLICPNLWIHQKTRIINKIISILELIQYYKVRIVNKVRVVTIGHSSLHNIAFAIINPVNK